MLSAAFASLFTVNMGIKRGKGYLCLATSSAPKKSPPQSMLIAAPGFLKLLPKLRFLPIKLWQCNVHLISGDGRHQGRNHQWRSGERRWETTVDELEEAGILAQLLNKEASIRGSGKSPPNRLGQ